MNCEQVQGTNDSSIVSKLSMVDQGYFEDPFIKYFVEKPSRRSPLINTCYFARAASISFCVEKFLKADASPKQIVSLGAGFDTTYFRMKANGLAQNLLYVEVDFPDVMKRKITLAKRGQLFQKDECEQQEINAKVIFQSGRYVAVGTDLQLIGKKFHSVLSSVGVSFEIPTLFLSEVVLTYLPSKKSTSVLRWISGEFSNAVLVVFEQVSPHDSFGKVMMRHFKQIGSPLLTINDYPRIADHIERHRKVGLQHVSATSLDRFCRYYVPRERRNRIRNLEVFDEFEAWHRACQHYFLLCSTNSEEKNLQKFCTGMFGDISPIQESSLTTEASINASPPRDEKSLIQRYGHCSCKITRDCEYAVIIGGFGIPKESGSAHQRLHSDVCLLDLSSGEVHHCEPSELQCPDRKPISFPMFSTAVSTGGGPDVLLFGGRASPTKTTSDLTTLTVKSARVGSETSWTYLTEVLTGEREGEWPEPRWRHCAQVLSLGATRGERMVVFGGRDARSVFGDWWIYDVGLSKWSELHVTGAEISPRHSSACAVSENSVFLSGGLDQNEEPLSDLFQIDFTEDGSTILAQASRVKTGNILPPLYSHTSHVARNFILMVGGVTSHVGSKYGDEGANDAINVVDLKSGDQRVISVKDGARSALLNNHSSVMSGIKDELIILGGGDNCFSFGTWFNRTPLIISLDRITKAE